MTTKRARKQSLFIRYIRGPTWLLARVRDLCVQGMTGGAGHVSYGNTMGCPTPQIPSLPRSFSANSSDSSYITAEDELRELRRLTSTRSPTWRTDVELRRSKSATPLGKRSGGAPVARSHTVGFGKIDEDKPIDFGESDKAGLLGGDAFPRSKSVAAPKRSNVV